MSGSSKGFKPLDECCSSSFFALAMVDVWNQPRISELIMLIFIRPHVAIQLQFWIQLFNLGLQSNVVLVLQLVDYLKALIWGRIQNSEKEIAYNETWGWVKASCKLLTLGSPRIHFFSPYIELCLPETQFLLIFYEPVKASGLLVVLQLAQLGTPPPSHVVQTRT